jgi:hypothetical protein
MIITETVEITGRGTAALFDEYLAPPCPGVFAVTVHRPDGLRSISCMASHELVLRRPGRDSVETSALLFVDIDREQLPAGSRVEIHPDGLASER